MLGPPLYGLPYRLVNRHIAYRPAHRRMVSHRVAPGCHGHNHHRPQHTPSIPPTQITIIIKFDRNWIFLTSENSVYPAHSGVNSIMVFSMDSTVFHWTPLYLGWLRQMSNMCQCLIWPGFQVTESFETSWVIWKHFRPFRVISDHFKSSLVIVEQSE